MQNSKTTQSAGGSIWTSQRFGGSLREKAKTWRPFEERGAVSVANKNPAAQRTTALFECRASDTESGTF